MAARIPCHFFVQGRCTKGPSCRFAHGELRSQISDFGEPLAKRQRGSASGDARQEVHSSDGGGGEGAVLAHIPLRGKVGCASPVVTKETLLGDEDGIRVLRYDESSVEDARVSEMRAYRRGNVLGEVGEMRVEVQGDCRLRLAVHASKKIEDADRAAWEHVPVRVGGQSFESLNMLHKRIKTVLSKNWVAGVGSRVYGKEDHLLRCLFAHHPNTDKMKDVSFIKVGNNQHMPGTPCFRLMRSEHDGCDISYVACLRGLLSFTMGDESEPVEIIMSLQRSAHNLKLWCVGNSAVSLTTSSSSELGFVVRFDLESKLVRVETSGDPHSGSACFGPWQVSSTHLRRYSGPVLGIIDEVAPGNRVSIDWAPVPACTSEGSGCKAGLASAKVEVDGECTTKSMRRTLDMFLASQHFAADLGSISDQALQRGLARGLLATLQEAKRGGRGRSRDAMEVEARGLACIAAHEAFELNRRELQAAREELQALRGELCARKAVEEQLREELRDSRVAPAAAPAAEESLGVAPEPHETHGPRSLGASVQPLGENLARSSAVALSVLSDLQRELSKQLPELPLSMLRASLRLMSTEMYSSPARALWELVQNADDCTYKSNEERSLRFVQTERYIWLEYNEVGFTERDVRALCNVGASTKGKQHTGQKGIGFKAAFTLSARPHVLSPPYCFFFDEAATHCPLPQVTPRIVEDEAGLPLPLPSRGTAIYLPLRGQCSQLADSVEPDDLLFLKQLRVLTLDGSGQRCNFVRRGRRDGIVEITAAWAQGSSAPSGQYEVERGGEEPVIHRYLVVRRQVLEPSFATSDGDRVHLDVAVAFPLDGVPAKAATVYATLPLSPLQGLCTPLDAPFELTTSREALQAGSRRNALLRDALAELWLEALRTGLQGAVGSAQDPVNDHTERETAGANLAPGEPPWAASRRRRRRHHLESGAQTSSDASLAAELEAKESLANIAWQLQPGPEMMASGFWAPFAQRVREGLMELPLVPVLDSDEEALDVSVPRHSESAAPVERDPRRKRRRLPFTRCRRPSALLFKLKLGPRDVRILDLGIAEPSFLKEQAVAGSSVSRMLPFGPNDLLDLVIEEARVESTGPWCRGDAWRCRCVQALAGRFADLDLVRLQSAPLFPLLAQPNIWHACGDDAIFCSAPTKTPRAASLKVLDGTRSCPEDQELLRLLGSGSFATARDVALSIIRRNLHSSEKDSESEFSWEGVAFIGEHWNDIVSGCATEVQSSGYSNKEVQDILLGSLTLPVCGNACLHSARELLCPYIFGAWPNLPSAARIRVVADPPNADTILQRLFWEFTFLRLGVQAPLCAAVVFLPKELFLDVEVATELMRLLDHYQHVTVNDVEALGQPPSGTDYLQMSSLTCLRRCCRILDLAGDDHPLVRGSGRNGSSSNSLLLGPAFEPLLGPECVIDVGPDEMLRDVARRLADVELQPSAGLVLELLPRAARHCRLPEAYRFVAAEWCSGRLARDDEGVRRIRAEGLLLPMSSRAVAVKAADSPRPVPLGQLCWQPQLAALLGQSRELEVFFVEALGVLRCNPLGGRDGVVRDDAGSRLVTLTSALKVAMRCNSGDSANTGVAEKTSQRDHASNASCVPHGPKGYVLQAERIERTVGSGSAVASSASHSSAPLSSPEVTSKTRRLPPMPQEHGVAELVGREVAGGESKLTDAGRDRRDMPAPCANLLAAIFADRSGSDVLWGGQAPARQQIPLEEIWFTQLSVSRKFLHGRFAGKSVREVASSIAEGQTPAEALELAVAVFRGRHYTLNNRSLYALRLASSESGKSIVVSASVFDLCPATAKFIQLWSAELEGDSPGSVGSD